ncbi:PDZ and LIM domain protein Zasp isoform X13 [Glossina fuscipes]|uniref:PDZ and LIM domain protein Zasp isoform X13 n=1 Tax=Glossina fuscipes TaxID=7396 RepID=A0A9C6E1Q5_9MUSC|nr:PDZ and LIM domain protein Zasp isoform X13 [Glossina fuscipes]
MSQPQLLQIKLSRFDAQPWGFRLQGGVDFASPLLVQKVNGGSLAEQAGLMPGDSVVKINDVDVFNLRHKEAQDVVVRSGNNFVMTVQRGGSTWRPQITPTGQLPQPNSPYLQTVTKTSLAHKQLESQHVGCGYNNAAKPFTQGVDGSVKSIVNKQYNSPVGIYSDESIAETLSAQAEVLAGGVLGVNFKKNEKEYHAEKSEVLKLLREEESGKSTPVTCVETAASSTSNFYWTHSHAIGGNERRYTSVSQKQHDERTGTKLQHQTLAPAATHRPNLSATMATQTGNKFKPIDEHQSGGSEAAITTDNDFATASASQPDPRLIVMPVCPALQTPEYKAELEAAAAAAAQDGSPRPLSAGGHPACQMCGVGIVGVFVRIKDKNLHVECFKCATCGTSLKNQGYYNFNNKLYCDIHAKLAALQNPPAGTEGYVPVPIKPNTKLSASTISSALSAHGYNGVANGNSGTPTPSSVVAPNASTSIIVSSSQVDKVRDSVNSNCNSNCTTVTNATNEMFPTMATMPSNITSADNGDKPFEYVTLTGNVIRSVVPPGKGSNVNYKVSQGYVRPFGAIPATTTPRSSVIYPPQPQQWSASAPPPTQSKPISNPYATLPRSNVGQQGRKVQSMYHNSNYSSNYATTQYKKTPNFGANRFTVMPVSYNKEFNYKNNYYNKGGMASKGGAYGATSAPKRGRGIINKAVGPGVRVPLCNSCNTQIRGPFITALGRIWCPEHFICVNANCRRALQDIGFVEEKGDLYCEYCFEKYLAPTCSKCGNKIKGDCLNAIGKHFHPECFNCAHCGKLFGNTPFFLEDGNPYCEADWNELFTTKCFACGFPVEAGDRWVEALNHNYHSQCFNCTYCKQNLEGQSFYNKGGRPFCKNHAR